MSGCFVYMYCISGSETRHIQLHLPPMWQAWFLCGDPNLFWDSVKVYWGGARGEAISAETDQPVCYIWSVLSLQQQLVQCALLLHCTKFEHNFDPKVVAKLQYWLGRLVHTLKFVCFIFKHTIRNNYEKFFNCAVWRTKYCRVFFRL